MHIHRSIITSNTNHHSYDKDEILMSRRSLSSSSSYIVVSTSERNDSYKLLQRSLDYNYATGVVDLSSEVSIALPFDRPAGCRLLFMGSCNGLILLLVKTPSEIFCIWNPCTKEYKILPRPLPHPILVPTNSHMRFCYGFGYDHTSDDYKVIIRTMYSLLISGGGQGPVLSEFQVYTLGTNSWRKVIDDGPNPGRRMDSYVTHGFFVNGVIYWISHRYGDIFSFDIGKEKFGNVSKIPSLVDHDYLWTIENIKVFEGFLCVVLDDHLECHKEIWVMKQANADEYLWTKLFAIPHLDDCYLCSLDPLSFTRNGEILMATNGLYLRLYDPKTNNVKTICGLCEYPDSCHTTDDYTETLVSLNSRTYMC